MAGSTASSITHNPSLKDALAEQRKDKDYDCLPCRLMGSIAFTGLGIYSYASGRSQLRQREAEILKSGTRFGIGVRKFGIFTLSATLVGLGAYRLVN